MGWSEHEFELSTPCYFFNAYRGWERHQFEQARMVAFLVSKIPAAANGMKRFKISDLAVFPWEDEEMFRPKFAPIDKAAIERFNNAEIKPYVRHGNSS